MVQQYMFYGILNQNYLKVALSFFFNFYYNNVLKG